MAKSASESYEEHHAARQFNWMAGTCNQTGEPKPSDFLAGFKPISFKEAIQHYREKRGAMKASEGRL